MRQSPKQRLIKSSFRLSAELDQMIRATASATDRTPSELVRDAVAAYLGQDATGGRKMARRRPTPPPVDPALLRQVATQACFFSGALSAIRITAAMPTMVAATTNGTKKEPVMTCSLPPMKGPKKPATPQAVNSTP